MLHSFTSIVRSMNLYKFHCRNRVTVNRSLIAEQTGTGGTEQEGTDL